MTGKFLAILIVLCGLAAGVGVYYFQVYAFYDRLPPSAAQLRLTPLDGGAPQDVAISGFEGIDSDSSPIRYRACFDTALTPAEAAQRFEPYEGAAPRNAPGWFACFDAAAIGAQISAGQARVFTGQRNYEYGIDRVVALTEGGRGYVWHEINECGDKAYDGSPLGEDCPPPPARD